jgi:PAT family beta-lactamase induction signal transducer AmpG
MPARLALLGALYFVQGLPFGFQAKALPLLLRESGTTLTAIGWAGALAAPWALKALWAPLVDRFGSPRIGRRRSWILPVQALLVATMGAAAGLVDQGPLAALLALIFAMNLLSATQDIAVDGLAVDLLKPHELGPGNASQIVGFKLGMEVSGGLLVWASDRIGWSGLFLACAALTAAVWFAVLLLLRERPPASTELAPPRSAHDFLTELRRALTLPGTAWLLAVVATYKVGESLVDAMFKPFLLDAGMSRGDIGLSVGTVAGLFSIVGSLLGAVSARRLGLTRSLVLIGALRVLPLAGIWALSALRGTPTAALDPTAVLVAASAEHLVGGALTTVMFALMMSRVDRRIAATHFTLLASVEVVGKSPGSWLSGVLADALGYPPVFALGALLSLAWLGLMALARAPLSGSADVSKGLNQP